MLSTLGITILLAQTGISAGGEIGFLSARPGSKAPEMKVRAFTAKAVPEVKFQPPRMHDRDEVLRSSMRSMMADDDADDDIWYGTKPKNGLIQTSGSTGMSLDDAYMQESTRALSSAL